MKNLSELLKYLDFLEIIGNKDRKINSISYDSRKCINNSLFVAIKGELNDGNLYIPNSINSGANVIVCDNLPENILYEITYILVQNTRIALAQLSNAWYGFPTEKMKMVAVTGTNGKTTVTYLIKEILENVNLKTGLIGTTGIFILNEKIESTHTTPESLELFELLFKMNNAGIEIVIMEVSSHSLVQNRVYGIVYSIAAFTNLTQDHLDYHKSMEEYAKAKKILFDTLSKNAISIFNADDDYSKIILNSTKSNKISIGRKVENDFIIQNESLGFVHTKFELKSETEIIKFKINLLGRFNIDNCALSYLIAKNLGIEDIKIIVV